MNKKFLFIFIVFAILSGAWSSNHLTFNFNIDPMAFSTTEQLNLYEKHKNSFTSGPEIITVGISSKNKFNTYSDFLKIQNLTDSILNLEDVKDVQSIERIKYPIKMGPIKLETNFLPLQTKEIFKRKFNRLNEYSDITEKFLSKDRTSLSFYIQFHSKNVSQTIQTIKKILHNPDYNAIHILGAPVFKTEGNSLLQKETIKITILGLLLLLVGMALITPSFKRITLTLLFTTFNVCITLNFMFIFKFEITYFTTIIPCIIAILSFTDITHILHHYEELVQKNTPKPYIQKELFKKMGTPLILTSISNLFGFVLFFFYGGIDQILEMAYVASFGIIFAYFSTRFLLPFFLDYNKIQNQRSNGYIESLLIKVVNLIGAKPKLILTTFTLLFTFFTYQIYNQSKINMHYYEKDNQSLEIDKACAFYDRYFQGIRDIEVVIETKKGSVLTPSTIEKIDAIEKHLINSYGCKSIYSINTIIKRLERFKNKGNPKFYKIPKTNTPNLVTSLINNQEETNLFTIVSKDLTTTRIIGSLPDIGTYQASIKNKELAHFLQKLNFDDKQIQLGGKAYIFDQNVNELTKFVILAIVIGVLIVGIFTSVLFKSIWVGCITIITNTLPILFGLLLMLYLQVDLNPSSILTLTIIFGVALDDSIYLLGHLYTTNLTELESNQAILKSIKKNSVPLFITSLILSLLFLALTISSYHSIFAFGLIVSLSLLFAFLSDLLLLPTLLIIKKPNVK